MKTIQRQLPASVVKDMGDCTLECIVATSQVDRTGEVLDIMGLDTTNYEANPVVLLNHNSYGDALPIGKSMGLQKVTDKATGVVSLVSVTKFAADIYDKAETVYKLVRDGFMMANSIGFMPTDYMMRDDGTLVWTKAEMLEYSIVCVPANASALRKMKKLGYENGDIDWFKELSEKKNTEKAEVDNEGTEVQTEADETTDETLNKRFEVVESGLEILTQSVKALQTVMAENEAHPTHERAKAKQVRMIKKVYRLKKMAHISRDSVDMILTELNKQLK